MRFDTDDGPLDVTITALTIAGWTARDRAAVDHHIEELAAIGVPPPSRVPLFYKVSPTLLTQADTLTVLGPETSGELEPFLLKARGKLWLGIASDHTDRGLETTSVAHSKQVCGKPVAHQLWDFEDLADRLDGLQLSSHIEEDGSSVVYQDGTLEAICPLSELLQRNPLAEGAAMLCGTLGAIGDVRPSNTFSMRLSDPLSGRTIFGRYSIATLPVRS